MKTDLNCTRDWNEEIERENDWKSNLRERITNPKVNRWVYDGGESQIGDGGESSIWRFWTKGVGCWEIEKIKEI